MIVTGFYTGLLALFLIFLILQVARRRWKYSVSLGDAGNEDLQRYVRAHGNFVETVPLAVILMVILEMAGVYFWIIHLMGILLIIGRIIHYFALTRDNVRLRPPGMILTLSVYAIGGLLAIWLFLSATIFSL